MDIHNEIILKILNIYTNSIIQSFKENIEN